MTPIMLQLGCAIASYHAESAKLARERSLEFLKKHLT